MSPSHAPDALHRELDLPASVLERLAGVERAERSAREARALAEIVRHINQSLELERVVALTACHAAELLGARGARVGILEGDEIVVMAVYGSAPDRVGDRLPVGTIFAGEAVRRRAPVRTSDLRASASRWAHSAVTAGEGRANAVAAPLLIGGRPTGAVMVFGNDARDFDERDEELLLALAGHTAVAIENARLYRAAARTARHAGILAETARTLAFNVTPESLYAGIGRVARESLRACGFTVYTADPATRRVEVAHAAGPGSPSPADAVASFWERASGRAMLTGAPHFCSPPEQAAFSRGLREAGVQAVALLPLLTEGQPRGLLALRFPTKCTFDEAERHLLVDFSTQVAVAMRNASLVADLELRAAHLAAAAAESARLVDAQRAEREQAETAAAIARLALDAAGVEEAADAILGLLDQAVPSLGKGLSVLRGGTVHCVATRGNLDPTRDLRLPVEHSAARSVLASGAPLFLDDVRATAHPDLARLLPDGALLLTPLVARHRVIGLVGASTPAGTRLSPAEVEKLGRLASSVALAIDALLMREEERQQRERERHTAEQLRHAEKLAALGGLVAGVAHELNNPLTGISAFAQLLLEEPLSAEQLESVRTIKREADRAGGVISDLLTFARKAGPRHLAVDVAALVQQTLRLRAYSLRSAGVLVETDLEPELPHVFGDDQRLQQVLLNLVVNAEYAMRGTEARRLTIRARRVEAHLALSVSDTGTGMTPEVRQHLFEPFFTTKPAGEGTGLGLSVSYGIVQAHGGSIAVDSAPGRGTTFRIRLPLSHASPPLSPAPAS